MCSTCLLNAATMLSTAFVAEAAQCTTEEPFTRGVYTHAADAVRLLAEAAAAEEAAANVDATADAMVGFFAPMSDDDLTALGKATHYMAKLLSAVARCAGASLTRREGEAALRGAALLSATPVPPGVISPDDTSVPDFIHEEAARVGGHVIDLGALGYAIVRLDTDEPASAEPAPIAPDPAHPVS